MTSEDEKIVGMNLHIMDSLFTENDALKLRVAELEAENKELKTGDFFGEEEADEWVNCCPFEVAQNADLVPCEYIKVLGSRIVYEKYIASVPTSLDVDGNIDGTELIEFNDAIEALDACSTALKKLKKAGMQNAQVAS